MTELPDAALLRGLRDAPKRGRKPSLGASDITRAAIAVADAEGLAAVSMARVAQELGNSTMALYRHVKSKDELLALMSDAALESPPALPDGEWRERLLFWVEAVLAAVRGRPWCAQVPVGGPPVGPQHLAWFDRGLDALTGTPLEAGEKVGVVMGLMTFVRGEVRLGASLMRGYEDDLAAFGSRYGAVLRALADSRKMPALAEVVASGVFDLDDLVAAEDVQAEFEFGLHLFLEGVAACIAQKKALEE